MAAAPRGQQKLAGTGGAGAGKQAGAEPRGAMGCGHTGPPFCLRAWAQREARVCHGLRSGRGNVKEEEPEQKRGFICLFLPQISRLEGNPVGVCISD